MFTLKTPTGQPLFETFQVSLICDKCLAGDHPEKCTHRAAEVPRWISNAKMETIKTLLADDPVSKPLRQTQTTLTLTACSHCTGVTGVCRSQALLMRESMGISAETTTRAFPEPNVKALIERPLESPPQAKFIFTSVDPAGGGSSNFAICSVALCATGQVTVLGLEALRTREAAAQHKLLIDHMSKLRSLHQLNRATFVLGLESNLGFEAQHVVHTLRREGVRGWVPLLEGVDGTVGLLTTNSSKEVMCVATQQLLADNRLLVSRSLLSVASPPKEVLQQLTAEMRSYMVYVDPPKTLFGKSRRTFTGKMGGHNDDLVIALQLAVLTMQIFTRSEKYRALM